MKKESFASRLPGLYALRAWLNNLPIQDALQRRMAMLLQVILIGLMGIIILATIVFVMLPSLSVQEKSNVLISDLFGLLVVVLPLVLLRRGYFRIPVLIMIGILFITPTLAVTIAFDLLRGSAILFQFTLAIILAGLLVSRRALILTYGLSAAVVAFSALQGQSAAPQLARANVEMAVNFILFNGLIALFIDRFGFTLRAALTDALARESELQIEISERRRAEAALRASENRYSLATKATKDVIWEWNMETDQLSWNENALLVFGYSPDEVDLTEAWWEDHIHADDRERVLSNLNAIVASGGTIWADEYRFQRRDGSFGYSKDRGYIERDAEGEPRRMIGAMSDVTERKQAEETLRRSEERFRALTENNWDGIVLFNANGNVTYSSPSTTRILGYDPDELVGQSAFEFIHQDEQAFVRELLIKSLEQPGEHIKIQARLLHKDGTWRWLEGIFTNLLHEPAVQAIVNNYHDFTERKQAEEEREKLIEELTAKNAELERLTYTVSHDLKSPLVTMKGFLGYLEQDAVSGNMERLKGDIKRIDSAVDKMGELLSDLLELSRIGRFIYPSEHVPFEDLVRAGLERVQERLEERGVVIELHPDLPVIYGDRVRLVEVTQNLIDNAAKYVGDQLNPRIEIGMNGEDPERGEYVFFIRDNGMGIAPEYHEKIFGLFNKLDPRTEGTGIGLALVRRIIEFHGGRIWVESEAGKGSTFFFTLPKAMPMV